MPIITPTHPDWSLLFQPALPVTDYATQVQPYVAEMRRLIEVRNGGYAISAPQIGIPYRFFIWGGRHWKTPFIRICVNPRVVVAPHAVTTLHKQEGCMSFPGKRRDVERASSVILFRSDMQGGEHNESTDNFQLACTWQHECDHLDGNPLWLADGSENSKFNVKSEEPKKE